MTRQDARFPFADRGFRPDFGDFRPNFRPDGLKTALQNLLSVPLQDTFRTDKEIIYRYALPGVDPKNLDVEVKNNEIRFTVKNESAESKASTDEDTSADEKASADKDASADQSASNQKASSKPTRELEKPYTDTHWFDGVTGVVYAGTDVNTEGVTAELENGVLVLVLPLKEEKQARKVNVQTGS